MGRGSGDLRGLASGAYQGFGQDYNAAQGERTSLRSSLLPRVEQMASAIELPEEGATKARTMEAINASAGAGQQQMENRVARTHNSAGAFAAEAAGAQQREQNQAAALRDLAGQRLQRKQMGMQQLAQMYGIDTNFLQNLGGQRLGALGAFGEGIGKWSAPFGISGG